METLLLKYILPIFILVWIGCITKGIAGLIKTISASFPLTTWRQFIAASFCILVAFSIWAGFAAVFFIVVKFVTLG